MNDSQEAKSNLTTGQMVAYAAGGMAMNLTNLVISQWLPQLYRPDDGQALISGFSFFGFFTVSAGFAFGLFFAAGRCCDQSGGRFSLSFATPRPGGGI